MIKWSDDFDPNDSIKNPNSVWMKTLTVATTHNIKRNVHLYTYPVAVGLKSSNHEEVEEKFAEDIKLLCEGDSKVENFYSGAEKKL